MTSVKEWMASVGIGSAYLTLHRDQKVCHRGETVTGVLKLEGGAVVQHIETLAVKLQESWPNGNRSSDTRILDRILLASAIQVLPGEHRSFPFTLDIPDDARILTESGWTKLYAEADIRLAVNPRAELTLTIRPQPEVETVQKAMEMLGFRFQATRSEVLPPDHDLFITDYRAPEALMEQLDGCSLHLRGEEHFLTGWLLLQQHKHHLEDHVRALTGGDKARYRLYIPRADLWKQEQSHPEGALPYLQAILEKALVLPNHPDRWLLRASSGPQPASHTLLRPASGNNVSESFHLLRPVNEETAEEEYDL